jgi:hypothetical protein
VRPFFSLLFYQALFSRFEAFLGRAVTPFLEQIDGQVVDSVAGLGRNLLGLLQVFWFHGVGYLGQIYFASVVEGL